MCIRLFFTFLFCAAFIVKSAGQHVEFGEEKQGHQVIQSLQAHDAWINDSAILALSHDSVVTDTSFQVFQGDTFTECATYYKGELIKHEKLYSSGQLRNISFWKNGKLHGRSYDFFENGQLWDYSEHDMWEPVVWMRFYKNGLMELYHINDSVMQYRSSSHYYESGKLMSMTKSDMSKGDLTHEVRYYESGKLIFDIYLNAGKQKMTAYYENGNVMEEYYYIDITLFRVGEVRYYYEDGTLKHQGYYEDTENKEFAGIKTGTWSWWDANGNLEYQEIYDKGELIGVKEH